MHPRCIEPARGPVDADLEAPPSKSVTHRALVAAALAEGVTRIVRPLDADDTRRTRNGLVSLGVRIEDEGARWIVQGGSGSVPGGATVDCGDSGTTARFLMAFAALGAQGSRIAGSPRLAERPVSELVRALRALGARTEGGSSLPITLGGAPLAGGAVAISGRRSSQFASALLLVGAACREGLSLTVEPPRASFAYALMTVEVLSRFGVVVTRRDEGTFHVTPQTARAVDVDVEGDHSSAAYAFLAAAVTGGRARVRGLVPGSLQPDARFHRDLAAIGMSVTIEADAVCVEGTARPDAFDWDLGPAPDLAPAAAVLALFARGTSRLRGLANLRIKESDRLAAIEQGLSRLGATTHLEKDELFVTPPAAGCRGAPIDVHGDHRIAMAFAVAGLRIPGIVLSDAAVVAKSYPSFWDDHARLGGA